MCSPLVLNVIGLIRTENVAGLACVDLLVCQLVSEEDLAGAVTLLAVSLHYVNISVSKNAKFALVSQFFTRKMLLLNGKVD